MKDLNQISFENEPSRRTQFFYSCLVLGINVFYIKHAIICDILVELNNFNFARICSYTTLLYSCKL